MRATGTVMCCLAALAACGGDAGHPDWTFFSFVAGENAEDTFVTARLDDTYLVAAGRQTILTIDVSDPAAPNTVGIPIALPDTESLAVQGHMAYVIARHSLYALDFTNPLAPVMVGELDAGATNVIVAGTHAYLGADTAGLEVVDISNPSAMSIVGTVIVPDDEGGARHVLASGVKEPAVYIVAAEPAQSDDLRIIDVSNPAQPTLLPFARPGAYGAIVANDMLFVGHAAGFTALSIASPLAPTSVAEHTREPTEHLQPIGTAGTRVFFRVGDTTPGTTESSYGYVTYVFETAQASSPVLEGIVTRSGTHVMYEEPYLLFSGDQGTGLQVWGPPE